MYCDKCGNNIDDGLLFCPYCGSNLQQQIPQNAQQNAQQGTVQNSQQGMPQNAQQVQQNNQQGMPQNVQQAVPRNNQQMQQYQGMSHNPIGEGASKKKMSTGMLVGIICGAVALVGLIVLLIVFLVGGDDDKDKSDKKADKKTEATVEETTTEAETETETVTTEEATTEAEKLNDSVVKEVKEDYLNVLSDHNANIRNYTWQRGYNASVNYPVSIFEMKDSQIESLAFMEAPNSAVADLYMYSYVDDSVKEVLHVKDLDAEVAGGTVFYVATIDDSDEIFIYHSITDEGSDEYFEVYSPGSNGIYGMIDSYECSSWPNEDYTSMVTTYSHNNVEIEKSEFDTFINGKQDSIDTFLMYSEGEDIDSLVSRHDSECYTMDDAISELSEGLDVDTESMFKTTLPITTEINFVFASGAGGWSTDMTIDEDGNFKGVYHDSNMGETGDGYPNGTMYYSSFSGKFKNITKIDDNTYKMEMDYYNTDQTPDTEEIYDDILYIYTNPYGIEGGKVFYLYLPDKPIYELNNEFLSWSLGILGDKSNDVTLGCYAIHNESTGQGFFEYGD